MLTADVAEFLATGCGLLVGTVSSDGMPHAARAWGADVLDRDEGVVRLIVPGDDDVLRDHLQIGGRIACTGADVRTLRSVQLKGRVVDCRPPTDDEVNRATQHTAAMFRVVRELDGNPLQLLERLVPSRYLVCDLVVEEVYDQTPGPRAGQRVDEP